MKYLISLFFICLLLLATLANASQDSSSLSDTDESGNADLTAGVGTYGSDGDDESSEQYGGEDDDGDAQ